MGSPGRFDIPSVKQIAKHNEHLTTGEHHAILNHIEEHGDDNFENTKSTCQGHKVHCTHNGGVHGESVELDEAKKAADEPDDVDQSKAAKRKAMQARMDALEDRKREAEEDPYSGKAPKANGPKRVPVRTVTFKGPKEPDIETDDDETPAAPVKRGRGRPKKIREEMSLEEQEELLEVLRKIRYNSHGVRSIKMKCMKGFKWDPTISACLKITGSEVAIMRRASRRALITKRSEGNALKVRFKRRINKAFRFRKMMGLKI